MNSPHVIVFFTDQQRWDTTGIHGNPLDLTPNFDRIAQYGTHVANAFTCQPVCGPARSCMQTGLYATQTGCFRNSIGLPSDVRTLAHYFREGGYATGYIGKWHLARTDTSAAVPHDERGGYEYWLGANGLEHTSDAYDTVMYDGDNRAVKLPGYRVDAVTDAAIRFIATPRQQPFFLFISYIEPHHQNHRDDYPAPDGYESRYQARWMPPDLAAFGGSAHQHLAGYYGMVKRLDEAFGRLLDALKSLNILDDTIVLFTSDHGNHFKTRNAEYKRSGHEASIRLPMAVHGRDFNGGGHIAELVSLIDVPPTLLNAAGLPIPAHMQGRSFLPLAQKRAADWQDDVFVQISEAEVGRAVRTQRWKYGVTAPDKDGWHDSASNEYQEAYLYDLLADPYELTNLIVFDSHREVKQQMRGRLLRRMAAAGESVPEIGLAAEVSGGQRRVTPSEARS